jgi:hypothetical protein
MLVYEDKLFGIQDYEVDLLELYPSRKERQDFFTRLDEFLKSDSTHKDIISLQGDILKYRSEIFISDKIDNRPPLLLLLGNPASHSVAAGMCFAFEKSNQDHRFWRLLDATGILKFLNQTPNSAAPNEKNYIRRKALADLKYLSPFRIGIAVFYSLPSAASDKRWSGVSGLRKLFRAKAFDLISHQEEKRIGRLITRFIGSTGGGIIAFQKGAYERVRSVDSRAYSQELANRGLLQGKYKNSQNILLAGAPPTRLAYTDLSKSAMLDYKNWLTQHLCTQK